MWIIILIIIIIEFIVTLITLISIKVNKNNKSFIDYDALEKQRFGKLGENYVSKHLEIIINEFGGYLYNDFCFEDEKGYSTEIDHILITRGGIFIIETKTNKGIIYGNKDDEYWISRKKEYQEDKSIKNPIIQNNGHINHLKRMFKNYPPKMISVIIFPLADISNINSNVVFNLNDAIDYIIKLTKSNKYSIQYVERINKQILDIKSKYSISKEKHIKNINKNIINYLIDY